jgi:hypothetical protein
MRCAFFARCSCSHCAHTQSQPHMLHVICYYSTSRDPESESESIRGTRRISPLMGIMGHNGHNGHIMGIMGT